MTVKEKRVNDHLWPELSSNPNRLLVLAVFCGFLLKDTIRFIISRRDPWLGRCQNSQGRVGVARRAIKFVRQVRKKGRRHAERQGCRDEERRNSGVSRGSLPDVITSAWRGRTSDAENCRGRSRRIAGSTSTSRVAAFNAFRHYPRNCG